MLLSELIDELEECINLYGDKEIYVKSGFGYLVKATEIVETGIVKDNENCVIAII